MTALLGIMRTLGEVLLARARRQAELLDGVHAQAAEGILVAG